MSQDLVQILEKGLSKLKHQSHSHKTVPQNKLSQGQKITEEDAEWLDKDANFVGEASVIAFLKEYPQMDLDDLDEEKKVIVKQLPYTFNRQIHLEEADTLKNTKIDDYFVKK